MMAPRRSLNRREALQIIGGGLGSAALGGGCLPRNNRCAQGPTEPAGGAPGSPQALLAGIDTFVVVMLENRSFDHFFGALRLDAGYPHAGVIDGLRGDEMNLDENGNAIHAHRAGHFQPDDAGPAHDWDSCRKAWNGGRNDAFAMVNPGPYQDRVMGYYDREFLPFQYALADRYTVCERWFSSVMGPTFPNRFYLNAATSEGLKANRPLIGSGPMTIWEAMSKGCWSAKNYSASVVPWFSVAFAGKAWSGNDAMVPEHIESFFADARDGNLPNFALVDPDYKRNDHHPPHDFLLGEIFLAGVFRALAESPQWPRMLVVFTYDEHGGFFDHVPPPTTVDQRAEFRQLGFRVPALVMGGMVRPAHLDATVFEHVSILATLRTRFGIESLNARMDAARDLSPCIDPDLAQAPAPPPRDLPQLEMAASRVPDDEGVRRWLPAIQELDAVKISR